MNTRIDHIGQLSSTSWRGTVTAKDALIDIPSISRTLDDYYVPVNPRAKTRCIDGRHDPLLDEAELGPQVPGGIAGIALAHRLGVSLDDLTQGTFMQDFELILEKYLELGLSPGGHRDNGVHNGTDVGCGAIDGISVILECLSDKILVQDSKRLTRLILGAEFSRDSYLRVLGASLVSGSRADDYFMDNDDLLPLLESKAPGSVSTLEGIHAEKLVIINYVPDTTLSSNRFADEHGGVQAFGYDMWRSNEFAQMLISHENNELERERFVTARVMIMVATLMALTDGSLQVLFRVPVSDVLAQVN